MARCTVRISSALLLSIFCLGLSDGSAQSFGELARQQRERVRNSPAKSTRVFTNEDLAPPKILAGPEQANSGGQAPIALASEAAATAPDSAGERAGEKIAVPVWPEGTPLGDVSRYYRDLKELRSEPSENAVLEQDTIQVRLADPASSGPRQDASAVSPDQPPQQPKQAGVTASPTVRANVSAPRVVRVKPGDSLWKIAAQHLGDGTWWTQIASANPGIADPNLIRVGQQLRLPLGIRSVSAAMAAAPNQVRVQAGDSLWKLAKAHWGTGSAWSCLAESNPQIQDSSRIYPGQTLALPATCSLDI